MYSKTLYAGWGDMDFNSHMRNTAYLDKSGDVRMMFFSENGLGLGGMGGGHGRGSPVLAARRRPRALDPSGR